MNTQHWEKKTQQHDWLKNVVILKAFLKFMESELLQFLCFHFSLWSQVLEIYLILSFPKNIM